LKKSFAIALSFLILLSSSGFSFSVDYCNKKKKISLTAVGSNTNCCCKKKNAMKDCCKNTTVTLKKIKDNYTPSSFTKIAPKVFASLGYQPTTIFSLGKSYFQIQNIRNAKAPPDLSVSLNILYRCLLV